MSDDAFITLRVSKRLLGGEGLVWNAGERVQVFTHPAWGALLTATFAVLGRAFWAALLLGIGFTAAALAVLVRAAPKGPAALIVLVGLGCSRSFVDFSTSGLENPLLHLLALVLVLMRPAPVLAGALTGLALWTRLDTAPLFGVLLLRSLVPADAGERRSAVLLAGAPTAVWLLFSLFWFGALLPNPALAKLGAGVPRGEVAEQGLHYVVESAAFDPAGAALLVVGLLACLRRGWRLVGVAVLLQVLWVVRAGGDFMYGRFLTLPMVTAAAALASLPVGGRGLPAALALPLLALLGPAPPFESPLRNLPESPEAALGPWGLVDERSYYTPGSAVVGARWDHALPDHRFRRDAEALEAGEHPLEVAVGMRGTYADGRVWLVDEVAVTEPFLARLPAKEGQRRPGHLRRRVPTGYHPGDGDGTCDLESPELQGLCRDVELATRAPLFAPGRSAAVRRLLLGDLGQVLLGRRPGIGPSDALAAGRRDE